MLLIRSSVHQFFGKSCCSRRFSNHFLESDCLKNRIKNLLRFYEDFFELDQTKRNLLIRKHPPLCDTALDVNDLKSTGEFLKYNGFSTDDILKHPRSLLIDKTTIKHRLKILDECCIHKHKFLCLNEFEKVLSKKISILKMHKIIQEDTDVREHLLSLFDLRLETTRSLNDETPLGQTRHIILKLYLKAKLNISEGDKLTTSVRLHNRSFDSLIRNIEILQNQLNLDSRQIAESSALLIACPDNLSKLFAEVSTIAETPIREILLKRPQLIGIPVESIRASLHHIKSFGIAEDRVLNFLEILSLPPTTVKDRLMQLSKEKELDVFWSHPQVLRLIFHQEAAMSRIEFVDKQKLKTPSLSVLSSTVIRFKRYSREGIDHTKKRDSLFYLSATFNKNINEVENVIRRHPHWQLVPVISIKAAVEFLRYKKFTDEEIFQNIFLLLYPVPRIQQKLTPLIDRRKDPNHNQMIAGAPLTSLSNSTLLNLCLYYIEAEFHFSGDGVLFEEVCEEDQSDLYPTTIAELQTPRIKKESCQ